MSKSCGLLEFLYFNYLLHITRSVHLSPKAKAKTTNPALVSAYANTTEEALKYVISLIAKFGTWQFDKSIVEKKSFINIELVNALLKQATYINAKYETESMINLFDIQVSGERDQTIRIDMSNAQTDIVANKYGYIEVEREKDLFEGKNQIGDVDIIFNNKDGHYLLIEAKNHALPMDIYFKDVIKTQDHLSYLKKEWKKKVARRVNHLSVHHEKYGIPKSHLYIVVSRFPEIISHYSNLLILSIEEFGIWLEKFESITSFNEFHQKYYDKEIQTFNAEEMEELRKANLFIGRFAKE